MSNVLLSLVLEIIYIKRFFIYKYIYRDGKW